MRVKLFEFSLHEVPRGETLAEHAEVQLNNFLKEHPNIEILYTHMNSVVIPAEDGGGMFRESPAATVIVLGLFYRER